MAARLEVVEAMLDLGRCSVGELAARLERSPESLYYHLKQLMGIKLVRMAGSRKGTRRTEELFELVSVEHRIDHSRRSPAMRAAKLKATMTMLRMSQRQMQTAMEGDRAVQTPPGRNCGITRDVVRLSPANLDRVWKRFRELHELLGELDDPDGEGERVGITIAMCPL